VNNVEINLFKVQKKITQATTLSTKKFPKKNREPFYQKKDFKS